MEITKIDINLDFFIIAVITIIILLFSFPYFCQKAEQQKRNNIFEYIATFILLAAFIAPIYLYNYYTKYKKTNKYTIHYNQGTLKQTMTTQEIVDEIMKKNFFDNEIDEISVLTITIPSGDFNDIFLQHINQMKEETQKKEDQKFLENEIHKLK